MNKKKIIIIGTILLAILVIVGLYGTLATGETALNDDNVYNITLTGSSNEVIVPAGTSKTVIYQVTNTNKGKVNYGLVFAGDNIEVKVYDDSNDSVKGLIDYGETKFIKLIIINTGTTSSTASIKTVLGYENDSNLDLPNLVPSDHVFVTETYTSSGTGNTLISHIRNLYTSAKPELITQSVSNDNYYYSYQDSDETWGLMNDGLTIDNTQDATTTGLAKVVTDTAALTSGTEGNIRYFGASDKVNNYIYFNCNDYSNQTSSTCERWRIIGIVDGKVKIIRDDSIEKLAWDQDKNQDSSLNTYSNNWETSSLQLFLNGPYYNRGTTESHTYYSGSTGLTKTTLDLKTIGITEATRTSNVISASTWYLGGYKDSKIYSNDMYNYERQNKVGTTIYSGNPYTINANIGLMSASDYGYGTDLTKCSKDIYNYNSSDNNYSCRENNWLYNSKNQWLINPDLSGLKHALSVDSGCVGRYVYGTYDTNIIVRPVLYLNPELTITSDGDGSYDNPYRINVGGDSGEDTPVESPLQLGDYVSYTPIVESYPTDTDYTGYSSSQTIKPNELNLWRVVKKNDDGTIEIISEYVSSTAVYFKGQTGYLNLVGYLNTLAKQYETTGITLGSRHFGYNGQTEYLEPSKVQFTNPPPFTSSTLNNNNEDKGGGDTLYEQDFNDVNTVLGTSVADKVGTTTETDYWQASRYYNYVSSSIISWNGRYVHTSGRDSSIACYRCLSGTFSDFSKDGALRPIVILKPGLTYTGQGTSGSPWQIVS